MGCAKNIVDSEVLLTQLKGNNKDAYHQSEDINPDVVIVNTCGFIDNAKQQSVDTILSYAKEKELGNIKKLYVTGCLSERYKQSLETDIPEVDGFYGTRDLPDLLKNFQAKYRNELIGERVITTDSHYAFLKISEGCDRPCSFCAIPLMRGKHRSKSIEDIVIETKNLVKNGVKEIMVIAQDSTSYGWDLDKKVYLSDLLRELNTIDTIDWIRVHYAHPAHLSQRIIDAIADCDKVCNYLDMPVQHASDDILKSMKRGLNQGGIRNRIERLRLAVPNIALRTTLIVGYPGETEQHFNELYDFVEEMQFDRLGVFTYSEEEGTTAADLNDNVSSEDKNDRKKKIIELQHGISLEKNESFIGKTIKVIVDQAENNIGVGRTEFDSPEIDNIVRIDGKVSKGDFVNVKIESVNEFELIGIRIKQN